MGSNLLIRRRIFNQLSTSQKSILLLGPRQVGKSTLMELLRPGLTINLSQELTFLEFARNPGLLEEIFNKKHPREILIDEIQRLPSLLNTIQFLLDKKTPVRFLLTGASARKLKRGGANLLPGRIHSYVLGPLVSCELDYKLDVIKAMQTGTLPGIFLEDSEEERKKTLRSYVATYLKEEIQAESLTRNLEGFARFLDVVAQFSGEFLDIAKLADAAFIPRQSAVRYFEILEDTLLLHRFEAFTKSAKKRLVLHPRYFFFDCGIYNALIKNFDVTLDRIGKLFEHLIFNQILHSASALDEDVRISNYRTSAGAEVDLLLEKGRDLFAIEIKASKNISKSDLRGLHFFGQFYAKPFRKIICYLGNTARRIQDVEVLPWQQMLQEIGF